MNEHLVMQHWEEACKDARFQRQTVTKNARIGREGKSEIKTLGDFDPNFREEYTQSGSRSQDCRLLVRDQR